MLFDLLIILLVIVFSYLYTYMIKKYDYNKQLLFIILTLFVVSLYKFYQFYTLSKVTNNVEKYTDFTQELQQFLNQSGSLPGSSTPDFDYVEYKNKLSNLIDKVNEQNVLLKDLRAKRNAETLAQDDLILDINSSKIIQDDRIKQLYNQIVKTKDLITKAELEHEAKTYKKIPIFSSCIVSNADGSETVDTPTTQQQQSSIPERIAGVQPLTATTIPAQQTTQTVLTSDTSSISADSDMSKMINHIFKNGIDLNINV